MLPNDSTSDQPYHHGNVKEALVNTALKLIESQDLGTLSLRRLSREVGVTPSAVYNHFADKDALLLAIKTRIYDHMNQYFESHRSTTTDPEQVLLEICMAYYHYSNEYSSQFQFLFSSTLPLEWLTPENVAVSCRGILQVRKLVWQIYEKYQVPCTETAVVNAALLVWSQLHGIVTLRNSGSIKAAVAHLGWPSSCGLVSDEAVEQLIKSHLQLMVNGILHSHHSSSHH